MITTDLQVHRVMIDSGIHTNFPAMAKWCNEYLDDNAWGRIRHYSVEMPDWARAQSFMFIHSGDLMAFKLKFGL